MRLRRGHITNADAAAYLESLPDLRIRLTDPPSYDGVFVLANRYGLTVCDVAYLDLAVRQALPLASLDGALIRAAGQSGAVMFQP